MRNYDPACLYEAGQRHPYEQLVFAAFDPELFCGSGMDSGSQDA